MNNSDPYCATHHHCTRTSTRTFNICLADSIFPAKSLTVQIKWVLYSPATTTDFVMKYRHKTH